MSDVQQDFYFQKDVHEFILENNTISDKFARVWLDNKCFACHITFDLWLESLCYQVQAYLDSKEIVVKEIIV